MATTLPQCKKSSPREGKWCVNSEHTSLFLCPLRVDPLALYPTLPWSPSEICQEIVFNEHRTLLGRSFEGLGQVLEVSCQS